MGVVSSLSVIDIISGVVWVTYQQDFQDTGVRLAAYGQAKACAYQPVLRAG